MMFSNHDYDSARSSHIFPTYVHALSFSVSLGEKKKEANKILNKHILVKVPIVVKRHHDHGHS